MKEMLLTDDEYEVFIEVLIRRMYFSNKKVRPVGMNEGVADHVMMIRSVGEPVVRIVEPEAVQFLTDNNKN